MCVPSAPPSQIPLRGSSPPSACTREPPRVPSTAQCRAESVPSPNPCLLAKQKKKIILLFCLPSTCSCLAGSSLFLNHAQLSLWMAQAALKPCLQLNVARSCGAFGRLAESPALPVPGGFSSRTGNKGLAKPLEFLHPAPPGQSKPDDGVIKPSPYLKYCSGNLIPNRYLWLLISALLITAVSDL